MSNPASSAISLDHGAVADARGALWLDAQECLVVADIHLGYTWVQRHRGQMLPVGTPDSTVERLIELQRDYRPKLIVLLGDLVHAAVGFEPLRLHLTDLTQRLARESRLICLLGNHDRQLPARVAQWSLPIEIRGQIQLGIFRLAHGDVLPPAIASLPAAEEDAVWVVGHEHPCVVLGDGSMSALRVPCFLTGRRCIVLPAFSPWAAGCVVGQRPFLGPIAASQPFDRVIACMGARLLAIPAQKLLG